MSKRSAVDNDLDSTFGVYYTNILKRDPDINFLAFIGSAWQAVGVQATILQLRDRGEELHGHIFLRPHPITGKCVFQENFFIDMSGIVIHDEAPSEDLHGIERIVNLAGQIRSFKRTNKGRVVYILSETHIVPMHNLYAMLLHGDVKTKFVIIDDGAANYTSGNSRAYLENGVNIHTLSKYFKIVLKTILINHFERYCKRNNRLIYNQLLDLEPSTKDFILNESIIKYYREVLGLQVRNNCEFQDDYFSGKILLCTSAQEENGLVPENEDLLLIEWLEEIAGQINVPVIVKCHPRQKNIKKYNKPAWEIMPKTNLTIEALLSGRFGTPLCIVGGASSALVNVNALYSIPAISMGRYWIDKNTDPQYKADVIEYINIFKNEAQFPNGKDEFYNALREACT